VSGKEKDDYVVSFKGAKLKRSQANRLGFSIICSSLAAILLVPMIGESNPRIAWILVISVAVLAFTLYRGRRQGE
jgi:hypothetical protein